jgi:two-component system, NtrC family, sensor histidine kinase GlrK
MGLRTRYLVSLLALVVVMTIPIVYGMHRVRELRAIALDLRHEAAGTAIAAGRMSRRLADLDRHVRAYVATTETELEDRIGQDLDAIEREVQRLVAFGYGPVATEQTLPIEALRLAADTLASLVQAGALEEATRRLAAETRPLLAQAQAGVESLSHAIDQKTAARTAEAERIAAATMTATTTAVLASIAVALLLAWLAARLLTRPLHRLRDAMGAVAEGTLEAEPDPAFHRADEIGDLFRSFHAMTGRLVQLDRMKAEFVRLASHDLKSPINIISSYAELIEDSGWWADDRQRDVLRALRDQSRSLAERLDQLIEISRIEARGLRLGLEEINLRHFAAGIEAQHALTAIRHGIDLAVSVAPETPTFVVADPDCLRAEVVGNLLAHAIKFSPPDSTVRVHFEGGRGSVRIRITDHGPPVSADQAHHLFDPYYRGSTATGRAGSGVGLPVAYAGAQAHGGRITVESDETATRFLVELPLHGGTPSAP